MNFRISKGKSVYQRLLVNSAGQLVTGENYQIRKSELVDPSIGGYTHAPEDDFALMEYSKGQYAQVTEGGLYDIVRAGSIWTAGSPVFVPDYTQFTTGLAAQFPDGWFGDGSDGNVEISINTTLTRDMFYNNLIVDAGITLTSGYRIFVKVLLTLNGTIANNGGNGTAGGNGSSVTSECNQTPGGISGSGGTAPQVGYFLADAGAGVSGGAGAHSGITGPGSAPANPTLPANVSNALGVAGNAGTSGGAGGRSDLNGSGVPSTGGGSAGTVSVASTSAGNVRNAIQLYLGRLYTPSGLVSFNISGQNGGSAGGACGGWNCGVGCTSGSGGSGGGGGGNGANGGICCVIARKVIGIGNIQATGGNGGNGGTGGPGAEATCSQLYYTGAGGGGGGGNGGNGGAVLFMYYDITQYYGAVSVIGGNAGTGGSAGLASPSAQAPFASNGSSGSNGNPGILYQMQIT